MGMKIVKYSILAVLLSACGSPDPGFNTDYEPPKPQETSTNFELWYDESLSEPFIDRLEENWLDVQACVGIAAPAQSYKVTVKYIARENMPYPIGVYFYNQKKILVDEFYITPEWDFVVRHEMIHHLLHITGHSHDDNDNHQPSWMFNNCIYSDWAEITYYPVK